MTFTYQDNHYLIRIHKGEELMNSIQQFCAEQNVCGTFTGLGGSHDITIAYYNTEKRDYIPKEFSGQLYEIVNITGNANAEFVHAHMTIGDQNYQAYAGHCLKAVADPTIEIHFTVTGEFTRLEEDPGSHLKLLQLPGTV